jgi:integrase/recombinase XerC
MPPIDSPQGSEVMSNNKPASRSQHPARIRATPELSVILGASPAATGVVDMAELLASYRQHLERSPFAANTRTAYDRQVRRYLAWLEECGEPSAALSSPLDRDFAVRDYRAHLRDTHLSAASVNAALAALDHLYRFLELGPPLVRREQLAALAPRALSERELRAVLRAGERRGNVRDRAAVGLMTLAGLRIAEVAGLDVDDVALSARKGHVVVRHGKGDTSRTVPLGALARELVDAWRRERPPANSPALFVSAAGTRLSIRSLDRAVRLTGAVAGVPLSAHVLRHTFVTRLVRAGVDVVTVAELAGHRSLETTRRYSLPSEADRQAAVEHMGLEL